MSSSRFPLFIAAAAALCTPAFSATVITYNSGANNNVSIAQTFGDNITTGDTNFTVSSGVSGIVGTPDIDLSWAASASTWQYHSSSSAFVPEQNGALQMDNSGVGSTYSITFTPTSTYGVLIGGFSFANDTGGNPNVNYNYTINIVDVGTSVTQLGMNFVYNPSVNTTLAAATANINYSGAIGRALRLDIVRVAATSGAEGNANDIYIDNLAFDQIAAVPEPSTYGLMGAGALAGAALVRRRRKTV